VAPHAITVRTDDGRAHASFAYGPVTPVRNGDLRPVLSGTPPSAVFPDADAFHAAIERAQHREPGWRERRARLTVRRVSWGEVDATLVG
jgi:hypothetical protein